MDVIGEDTVRTVSWQKPARVGYTKILVASMAYQVSHKRRNVAIYQPTDSDAAEFKKDEINATLRDVPSLGAAMLAESPEVRSKHNTLDRVAFQGSTLYVSGGKSARNYRRKTLDVVKYDELDGFDPDIEGEGDATSLGDTRLAQSPFPKSIRGSTPRTRNESQIERSMAAAGVVLRRWLPCPECGEFHALEWKQFHYDRERLERPWFACPHCAACYGYERYAAMDRGGRWQSDDGRWVDEASLTLRGPDGPVAWPDHVGFFLWAAYSYVQSWGRMASLWVEANDEKKRTGDQTKLKSFVNTQLAETWEEATAAVDADVLYARREEYPAEVPSGAMVLVMGVDTHEDRLELEVIGTGPHGERWGVAYKTLYGDPADGDVLAQLDVERARTYRHESGADMRVLACGIDSGGHRTQEIYDYCRQRRGDRVYAFKGQGGEGLPSVRPARKVKMKSGASMRLYIVGVDALKQRLAESLNRKPGQHAYQHMPMAYTREWCEQITAEVYVQRYERGQLRRFWWRRRPRNEALDVRIYGEAALEILNPNWDAYEASLRTEPEKPKTPPPPRPSRPRRGGGFVTKW